MTSIQRKIYVLPFYKMNKIVLLFSYSSIARWFYTPKVLMIRSGFTFGTWNGYVAYCSGLWLRSDALQFRFMQEWLRAFSLKV